MEQSLGKVYLCQRKSDINKGNGEQSPFGGFLGGFYGRHFSFSYFRIEENRVVEEGQPQYFNNPWNKQYNEMAKDNKKSFYRGKDERDDGFCEKVFEIFHRNTFFGLDKLVGEVGDKENSKTNFKEGDAYFYMSHWKAGKHVIDCKKNSRCQREPNQGEGAG